MLGWSTADITYSGQDVVQRPVLLHIVMLGWRGVDITYSRQDVVQHAQYCYTS